jgi:hypothetical protein
VSPRPTSAEIASAAVTPELPVRETVPDAPPPQPLLGWVLLGIALAITGLAGLLFIWWIDRRSTPSEEPVPAARANAPIPSGCASPPVISLSVPSPPATAPAQPRRMPRRPAATSEIRDPWARP